MKGSFASNSLTLVLHPISVRVAHIESVVRVEYIDSVARMTRRQTHTSCMYLVCAYGSPPDATLAYARVVFVAKVRF